MSGIVRSSTMSWAGRRLQIVVALVAMLALAASVTGATAAERPIGGSDRVDVFVVFDQTPGAAEQGLVRAVGGQVSYSYELVPAIAASVPTAAVDGLARHPSVTSIEPDVEIHLLDMPDYAGELARTWGVEHIGAGAAHNTDDTGAGVRVAVLDTGIAQHGDLDYDQDCSATFVPDEAVTDEHGHGTHVAGTVAALRNGDGVVGVAPQADICALKVLSNDGSGLSSYMIAALEFIVEFNGDATRAGLPIAVTNNSYGFSGDPGPLVEDAFDRSYEAGVLHVTSAGNSGNPGGGGSNCTYPAPYGSVLAVAATDQNDNRARFSSTCSQLELSAPGVSITSTVPGGGYATYSGTSMASPHVAGTAALLLAANPDASVDELRQVLTGTAQPLGSTNEFGAGLVQPVAALTAIRALAPNPTGTIAGIVTDVDGTAIDGATVTVDGTDLSATTATDGSYTIDDVPEGASNVTADADGYQSETKSVTVAEGQQAAANFTLTAIPTGAITGTVTDVDGTAIDGATVTVDGTDLSATTATDGNYTIDDVPEGASNVTATADGYQSETKQATIVVDATATVDFTLNPVEEPEAGTVTVGAVDYTPRGGRENNRHLDVTVTLVDVDGRPVADTNLTATLDRSDGGSWDITGTTGSDGTLTYTLNNHGDGCYDTTVTQVDADGWDQTTPDNGYCKP